MSINVTGWVHPSGQLQRTYMHAHWKQAALENETFAWEMTRKLRRWRLTRRKLLFKVFDAYIDDDDDDDAIVSH